MFPPTLDQVRERFSSVREQWVQLRAAFSSQRKPDGNPRVSIVTVVRNGNLKLERAMTSVFEQTYKNVEYIIVDGGSTDGTLDTIGKYGDRISMWISEPDNSMWEALNKGLSLASGEWIGTLNSDDWYHPGTVEAVVNAVHDDPEADLVYGNIVFHPDNRTPYLFRSRFPLKIWKFFDMPIRHPATFVKRETYEKFGLFFENFLQASDFEFMLRLFKGGARFLYLPQILAEMDSGGITERNVFVTLQDMKTSLRWHKAPAWVFAVFLLFTYGKWSILDASRNNFFLRFLLNGYRALLEFYRKRSNVETHWNAKE